MPPGFPCPFSSHIKYIQVRKNYPCLLFFQNGKSTAPHTQILLNDPSSWKSPENVQCHFLKEQTVPVKEAVFFLKPGSLAVILSSKCLFHSLIWFSLTIPLFLCLLLQKKLPMSEPDTGSYGGSPVPTVLLHPDHPLHRKVPSRQYTGSLLLPLLSAVP